MKKNKWVFAAITALYVILSAISAIEIRQINMDMNHAYRVDIHRIYAKIKREILDNNIMPDQVISYQPEDYPASDYVKHVAYLAYKIKDASQV